MLCLFQHMATTPSALEDSFELKMALRQKYTARSVNYHWQDQFTGYSDLFSYPWSMPQEYHI
jgi:hypothetical protein